MANRVVAVRLRAEMAQFKKEWDGAGKAVGDAADQMDEAAKKAAATKVQLDSAGTSVGRAAVRIRENRQEWDHVGTSMLKAGAGLTIGAGLVTKAAMDWESSWTGVLKTVDGTPAQLGKVEDGLRGLAKTLPSSHQEIAGVAEAAGQLGIQTENIVAFTRTMIDLGETTNLSAEEAATSLARFSNIMGTNQADVGRLGSSIVGLGNNFATTESEILALATRLAGAGVQAKLSEGDVFGIATAMSSVGVEAEAGGSAMSLTMKRIGKEVESGGSKLGQFAEVAGMSSEQFSAAWKQDAGGALASFVEGLGKTEASGKSTNAVLSELGVTGLRESDALLRLSSATGVLRDAMNQGNAEFEKNSALTAEAAKRYDTAEAQVSIAWNNIKDSAIDAGQAMLPVVEQIANAVNLITDAFSALPVPVKGALGPIAALSGVALLAVGGTMKLAGALLDGRNAMAALQIEAPKTAGVLGKVGRAATVATAAFAGLQLVGSLYNSGEREGVATYTKQLLEMGTGSEAARKSLDSLFQVEGPGNAFIGQTYADINGLNDAILALDPGALESGLQGLQGLFTETRREAAEKSFQQVDKALTGMAQSGAMDEAKSKFTGIAEAMKEQGMSAKQIAKTFPEYTDAVQAAENAQSTAGESADVMSDQMASAAESVGMSAEELQAAQEAAEATAESFIGLGDSLSDSTVSLGDWLGELEKQNEALASFTANSIKAAREGLDEGLIASLQAAGPEGAMRLGELADASESEIARANEAFQRGQDEIATYIAATTGIPAEVISEFKTPGAPDAITTAVELAQKYEGLDATTVESILRALDYSSEDIAAVTDRLRTLDAQNANPRINVSAGASFDVLRGIRAEINGITGKTVYVKVAQQGGSPGGITTGYTGMQVPAGFAGGGIVPGTPPSNPTVDNVWGVGARTGKPIRVRSGEWIVNEPQSRKNPRSLAAINGGLDMDALMADLASNIISGGIPGYAGGGQVGRDAVDPLEMTRMAIRIRDLKRSLGERERYGKENKKSRLALRGLDRIEAKQELAEAQRDITIQRRVQRRIPRGWSAQKYNDQQASLAAAADDRASASESFAGNADIQTFSSPESVNRALAKAISDMATYTQLLIALKKKGAAPWLLSQLQKAGPSRGSINLARKYLTDTNALKAVNAQAAQLDAVSDIYGRVTADPKWSSSRAWDASMTNTQSVLSKSIDVKVSAIDQSAVARETTRQLSHELASMATGAGL